MLSARKSDEGCWVKICTSVEQLQQRRALVVEQQRAGVQVVVPLHVRLQALCVIF